MLTPKIDYQYLRSPQPNDARLIMNSCPNQKLKKNNKHSQILLPPPPKKKPNEQTKPTPSGGGLLGEGGGQSNEQLSTGWQRQGYL